MSLFIKSFSKTSTGSILSMAFGAIAVKIIAVVSGPQGVGIFSILKDISQTLTLAFSLSGNVAIVKNLSSAENNNKELFILNIVKIIIFNTIFMSLIYFLAIDYIYTQIMNGLDGVSNGTLLIIALSGIAGSFNVICNSILNANRSLGWMAISQTMATSIGALVTFPILSILPTTYSFALILVVINVSWLLINLVILRREKINFNWVESFSTKIKNESVNQFKSLAGATFITSIAGMATILFTRLLIEQKLGIESLGVFDAAWTLGAVYIVFLLSSFGTYVLPVLSSIHDKNQRDDFLGNVIVVTSSIFTILVITMITFNEQIILLFYSQKFSLSSEILMYLLLADFFKVISWTYGIFFLSHNKPWMFVFISLLWDIIFLAIIYFGIDQYGIHIVAYAAIIAHFIYLIACVLISRIYRLINLSLKVVGWLSPMAIIIISVSLTAAKNSMYIYSIAMVASLLMAYYLAYKKGLFLG
ncbi:oligosaccharide flippase family protein [bacterium]|nr:oligosaccharide flippase family protein [bacterium]